MENEVHVLYRIATIEDRIRVPPEKLGTDVTKALRAAISEQMEGVLNSRLGMVRVRWTGSCTYRN
ncbi:MAG: hypothetical protein NT016_01850 [Candidatus Aenigmarchaeota archaeon]|nr:hypothetical protein [Candidatus Aenigmarchaeota archaeon]